jgi:hypothetical protein
MNKTSIEEQPRRSESDDRPAKRAGRVRDDGARSAHGVDWVRVAEVGRKLATQVGEQTRKRPYAALGAATGLGFVAGSLFGSRLGQVFLAASLGYVAKNLLGGDLGVQQLQENLEKLAHERMRG